MAGPPRYPALEGAGFHLAESGFNNSSDRSGVAMTHHYVMNKPAGNGMVTHHVYVDQFDRHPTKPNVRYSVTQDGRPFAGGQFDTYRHHVRHALGGSQDPIGEILDHHRRVGEDLRSYTPPLIKVTPDNTFNLLHDNPIRQTYSTFRGEALDPEVEKVLVGDHRFVRREQLDKGTDVYQQEHRDPRNPHTWMYGVTVRHRPNQTNPYSYSIMRHQRGSDQGSFVDVGDGQLVANFGTLGHLVEAHQKNMNKLGLSHGRTANMRKNADQYDDLFDGILRANNYAGTCSNCGKAVRDIPESSFRDDKLYHMTPEDDAPDPSMHGDPVPVCGECYQDPDMHDKAHRMPKLFGWHPPGAKTGTCPDCDRYAMDEADEDLAP